MQVAETKRSYVSRTRVTTTATTVVATIVVVLLGFFLQSRFRCGILCPPRRSLGEALRRLVPLVYGRHTVAGGAVNSRDAHPVEVISLAAPLPCDDVKAALAECVPVGSPNHQRPTALQGKANQMCRIPTLPRRPGGVDMQAVRAPWKQMIRGTLLIEPVAAEREQTLACTRGLPLTIESAKPLSGSDCLRRSLASSSRHCVYRLRRATTL